MLSSKKHHHHPSEYKLAEKKRHSNYLFCLWFFLFFAAFIKKHMFIFLLRSSSPRDYPRPYTSSRSAFGHSRESRSRRLCTSSRFGFAGSCSCSKFGLPFLFVGCGFDEFLCVLQESLWVRWPGSGVSVGRIGLTGLQVGAYLMSVFSQLLIRKEEGVWEGW